MQAQSDTLRREIASRPLSHIDLSTLIKVVNRGKLDRYSRLLSAHLHYELGMRKLDDSRRPN